ncbi:alpha/beta hydrolase [Kitasatospora sp. YST-16]|uniref:alpha/beta fold hydrolase n=1 Tax=Kitasatospora sp. YST-16 TaxID=2998080 RepID=UPI0022849A42|nr:alpha/beta hydrolase [Kitasatospora sp. YST-16]WAL75092.1 alpha/beta hydrolase [Kitasatospora sp. YST-16]WNW41150.1 alpha/beta hydrolase [Streptomyces sp. Li-HN-5-13]
MDVLLIGGLWLDGSAWDAVLPALAERGHRPVPLTLPGQGDGRSSATLAEQLAAVVAAVDAAAGEPLVVAHSAACTLGWMAVDARPQGVAGLVLVDGFPHADGQPYAEWFPPRDGAVPFPGWEPFEGPSSADLDDELRARIAANAVPVPADVALAPVRLADERRYGVPVTMLCAEASPEDVRGWVAAGAAPEVSRMERIEYVDLDAGHWPMFSRPAELAALIDAAAARN